MPDERYVEVPAAFVQLRVGAACAEQEVIDFCRGNIACSRCRGYVRFVDEWPMSGTKIQEFRLRERLESELKQARISIAPKLTLARS